MTRAQKTLAKMGLRPPRKGANIPETIPGARLKAILKEHPGIMISCGNELFVIERTRLRTIATSLGSMPDLTFRVRSVRRFGASATLPAPVLSVGKYEAAFYPTDKDGRKWIKALETYYRINEHSWIYEGERRAA